MTKKKDKILDAQAEKISNTSAVNSTITDLPAIPGPLQPGDKFAVDPNNVSLPTSHCTIDQIIAAGEIQLPINSVAVSDAITGNLTSSPNLTFDAALNKITFSSSVVVGSATETLQIAGVNDLSDLSTEEAGMLAYEKSTGIIFFNDGSSTNAWDAIGGNTGGIEASFSPAASLADVFSNPFQVAYSSEGSWVFIPSFLNNDFIKGFTYNAGFWACTEPGSYLFSFTSCAETEGSVGDRFVALNVVKNAPDSLQKPINTYTMGPGGNTLVDGRYTTVSISGVVRDFVAGDTFSLWVTQINEGGSGVTDLNFGPTTLRVIRLR
jgi:hypothetical protein